MQLQGMGLNTYLPCLFFVGVGEMISEIISIVGRIGYSTVGRVALSSL